MALILPFAKLVIPFSGLVYPLRLKICVQTALQVHSTRNSIRESHCSHIPCRHFHGKIISFTGTLVKAKHNVDKPVRVRRNSISDIYFFTSLSFTVYYEFKSLICNVHLLIVFSFLL